MIKTIVVGSNGSDHAQRAVEYAAKLAQQLDAEVVLVDATPPSPPRMGAGVYMPPEVVERIHAEREMHARNLFCAPLAEAGVRWQVKVVEGHASTVIEDTAREVGAQLIVVGTRGHHAVSEMFLGSTSHALSVHAPVPVVIVPPAYAKNAQAPATGTAADARAAS